MSDTPKRTSCGLTDRWSMVKSALQIHRVDPSAYRLAYPDVAASGMDPAVHYAAHGRAEGRIPSRIALVASSARKLLLIDRRFNDAIDGKGYDYVREIQGCILQAAKFGSFRFIEVLCLYARLICRLSGGRIICGIFKVIAIDEMREGIRTTFVRAASPYTFREPAIVGRDRHRPLRTITAPGQWIARIAGAKVIPGFQVIRGEHLIAYEPAGDPRNGFVAGLQSHLCEVRGRGDQVAVAATYVETIKVDAAVLISGRCSPNYFHVVVEYLSKLTLVASCDQTANLPLIVDRRMFPQEWQALSVLAPTSELIAIDARTMIEVRDLHIVSQPTFHRDNLVQPPWLNAALTVEPLRLMRERVRTRFGITGDERLTHRLIYLARRTGRFVLNGNEVEAALDALGFEVRYPEDLSFEDQVRLFSEARVIVGPLGAAFTNLIFASPDAKVIALASPLLVDYCMQSNLAGVAGCDYVIFPGTHPLVGEPTEAQKRDIDLVMDSFSVDAERLADYVRDVISQLSSQH